MDYQEAYRNKQINGSIQSVNNKTPPSPQVLPHQGVTNVKEGYIKKYEEQQRLKHKLKAQQQAKPFCFSKLLVRCPCLILLFVALFILFAISLIIGLGVFKFDEGGSRTYLVWSSDVVRAYDEITLAQGLIRDSIFSSGNSIPHSALYADWMTFFVYRAKNNQSILQSSNLIKIKQFEDAVMQRQDFQKFCAVNHSNPTVDICDESSFSSTLFSKLFDGVDLADQSAINTRVLSILNNPREKSLINKQLSPSNLQAKFARSIIIFASPLQGFKNIFDNQKAQKEKFIQFNIDIDNQAKSSSTDSFDILFGSRPYLNHQLTVTANTDLILAVVSFLAVYFYVTIHLRSFILASFGMFQTLLAFPVAYFFYRVIFQISFFTTIHNLAIFIILGVAADDLFVFNDAWRQSGKFKLTKGDLNKRMALTYRRASKAMFVTSFTTAAAFLATGFSDIMPISSFGFFASILIISNYCLVITMFPAFLMFTQKKCGKFLIWDECCCRCVRKDKDKSIRQVIKREEANKNSNQILQNNVKIDGYNGLVNGHYQNNEVLQFNEKQIMDKIQDIENAQSSNGHDKPNKILIPERVKNLTDRNQQQQQQQKEIQKLGCLEKFFSTKFNSFVRKFSIVILIILIIWVGVASYFASQMKPLSQQEQWLPDDN